MLVLMDDIEFLVCDSDSLYNWMHLISVEENTDIREFISKICLVADTPIKSKTDANKIH